MTSFERIIVYLSLICGTLLILTSKAGAGYFATGDWLHGFFVLAVTILTILGWFAPLMPKSRPLGIKATRILAVMLILASAYGLLRNNFLPHLPKIWP